MRKAVAFATAAAAAAFTPPPAGAALLPRIGTRTHAVAAAAQQVRARSSAGATAGTAGWPPGLHVFDSFGALPPEGVLHGSRELLLAVEAAARGVVDGQRRAAIPQPVRSPAHNLAAERAFVPLRVRDPACDRQGERARLLRCEHFAEYGSRHHALSYFRGNDNLPRAADPLLAALRNLDVVRALGSAPSAKEGGRKGAAGGDALGLHWKLTLNHYKVRDVADADGDRAALAQAGGALFPWHTDLAANGEVTAIACVRVYVCMCVCLCMYACMYV